MSEMEWSCRSCFSDLEGRETTQTFFTGTATERYLDAVVDGVRTPLLILDEKLRVLRVNRSFCRIFHVAAETAVGLPLTKLGDGLWDSPSLLTMLASVLSGDTEVFDFKFSHPAPATGTPTFLLDARRIPAHDSGCLILLCFEDVSDRVEIETVRRARDRAEQATLAKNEFLASMSHDIRTPMTVTLAALEHLLDMGLPQEQRKFLEMAMTASHSLLGLLDDILDLAKIEAGKLSFSETPFIFADLLGSVVEAFTPEAQRKGLKFSCEISPDLPPVVIGDPTRLRQVLVNLLGNAFKFTARGEISVKVEPRGEVGTDRRQMLSFAVRDTGIGIPRERRDDIFHSFSQLGRPRAHSEGSGLGLAICKRIVEQSGGAIGMEGEEDAGSLFFFTMPFGVLPGSASTATAAIPAKDTSPKVEATRRILIIEDEENIRELIAMLLQDRGWEVTEAASGREGLTVWEKKNFDLILMDLDMPEMDGLETTRRIRALETPRKHVPIMALTAHVMKDDFENCLAAGMDAFITKPFRSDEFLAQVETFLLKS